MVQGETSHSEPDVAASLPVDQQIKQNLLPTLKEADGKLGLIVECNGTLKDGRNFYAFVNLLPSKIFEFHEAIQSGTAIKLSMLGDVLFAGEGSEAPEDVKKDMQAKYGVDYHFPEKIMGLIKDKPSDSFL